MPAGEMGCVACERKKKLYIAGRLDGVRGPREKKKLYIADRRDGVRGRREKKKIIYSRPARKKKLYCRRDCCMSGGEKIKNKNKKQEIVEWQECTGMAGMHVNVQYNVHIFKI
jgi:hypothetical protein